ncbi:MAG TPA: SPOR domain-containing protein [Steroidobacteraceae bacterium]|jgi:cell division protein FtsN
MPAARDYKAKRKKSGGIGGWLGLGVGLATGLAVAGVVYLKDHKLDPPLAAAAAAAKLPKKTHSHPNDPPDPVDVSEDDAPTKYAFYDQLPKFEVVVPEKDKEVRPDIKLVPETRRGTYVLQAGSYRNQADADRVRAQLALQGIESKIQKVSIDNDTWERIRIGPISDLNQLNRMRGILHKRGVDYVLVRVGD